MGVNFDVKEPRNIHINIEKGRGPRKSQNRKCVLFVLDLKIVARLSSKDRYELIRSLKGRKKKNISSRSLESLSKERKGFLC